MTRFNLRILAGVVLLAAVTTPALLSRYYSQASFEPPTAANQPIDDDSDGGDWSTTRQSGLVTYSDHTIIPHGKCDYFHDKALATGGPTWWERYRKCENG